MAEEGSKKKPFRKYFYRGIELVDLATVGDDGMLNLLHSRARRHILRNRKRAIPVNGKLTRSAYKGIQLLRKLIKARKEAGLGEKPACVKTHHRRTIIVPQMIGCVVGIYNGKTFNQVEIRPDMIGHYLGEFSITYKPVKHGRPGIGATHSSRFVPLK